MEALRSFLIAFEGGQAVLPNSSMVEVLPYANPLKLENAPRWVVGTMLWRALNVPLLSLEGLIHGTDPRSVHFSRIVMIRALGTDPRLPYLGLLGIDAPHLINVERGDITTDKEVQTPVPAGVLQWVRIKGEAAIIPDMDAIEGVLRPLMHHHG